MTITKRPQVARDYPAVLTLLFDPHSSECTETRAIFSRACKDHIAQTLYLLWRYRHLTGPNFPRTCIAIAIRIRERRPQNSFSLKDCFHVVVGSGDEDFSLSDIDEFCQEAIPYFTGQKFIDYKIQQAEQVKEPLTDGRERNHAN